MPRVCALWRHPIKGHGREALERVTLTKGHSMPWDRLWAVAHDAARVGEDAWAPSVNWSRGSKNGALMAINTRTDEGTNTLTLSHPELADLIFNPDTEQAAFLDWVRPLMPADRAQSACIHKVEGRGMTDTDYPSVSLINMASNADLSEKMGQEVSPLRWRCNIHLENLEPWEEFDWIGKTLRIGSAKVTIREPILRCLATTANPATGVRDLDTLGALNKFWRHQNFGVYAEVTTTGDISVGDKAVVL